MHKCHYCHEYKRIQAFHESQEDQICRDCYADFKQEADEYKKAFILAERIRLKDLLQQIDKDELPF